MILGTLPPTIETVQALLVHSGYSEKGWILTSLATRMALDLDLPKAYRDLSATLLEAKPAHAAGENGSLAVEEREATLYRQARTWFQTFVLDHMCVFQTYLLGPMLHYSTLYLCLSNFVYCTQIQYRLWQETRS